MVGNFVDNQFLHKISVVQAVRIDVGRLSDCCCNLGWISVDS